MEQNGHKTKGDYAWRIVVTAALVAQTLAIAVLGDERAPAGVKACVDALLKGLLSK